MAIDPVTLYERGNLAAPPLPPRSRLYHLEPSGLGTPYGESLTSYVSRLAEAHRLPVRKLFVHEIMPCLDRTYPLSGISGIISDGARLLNGKDRRARDWVQALETLTMTGGLSFLTMLPWTNVLSSVNLLRPVRAWCPACYEQWQQTGKVIYDPLLWNLRMVTVCLHHQRRLQFHCPHPDCQKSLPLITPRGSMACCPYCERGLATLSSENLADNQPFQEAEWRWQQWVSNAVGELIATAPTLSEPPAQERIAAVISACVQQMEQGQMQPLARLLAVPYSRLRTWRQGGATRIDLLLDFCYRLDVSPLHFLVGPIDDIMLKTRQLVIAKAAQQSSDIDRLGAALELILNQAEDPPPRLQDVTTRLGCSYHHLQRYFPDLCQAITQRHQAYQQSQKRALQQTLLAILTGREEPPPSMLEVGRRLGYTSSNLYARFPELCRAISKRYQAYQQTKAKSSFLAGQPALSGEPTIPLPLDQLQSVLEAILAANETPPPSISQVANRFGYTRDQLRYRFPELCRVLSRQAQHYRQNQKLAWQQALEASLAHDENPPPSLAEVVKSIGASYPLLRTHFPELCQAITQRYQAAQQARNSLLRSTLELILTSDEQPPPSLAEVGRRLGYEASHLRHFSPELCQAIAQQRQAYYENKKSALQRALESILAENPTPPPTVKEVAQQHGYASEYLYTHFSELCYAITERHLAYKQAQKMAFQQALEAILASDQLPPPSMVEVARQLGCSSQSLRQYFPELVRAVSARYLTYRHEQARQKRQKLCDDIRQATFKLHAQGLYPSSNRVEQLLSKPACLRRPEVYRVWREALRDLDLRE